VSDFFLLFYCSFKLARWQFTLLPGKKWAGKIKQVYTAWII